MYKKLYIEIYDNIRAHMDKLSNVRTYQAIYGQISY